MNTQLLVLLDGEWKRLDIYEDIPISVVIQQLDLNVLDQRKSNYSKQFVIPNTHNNANVLEHYFEINGIDFNPLQKIEAVVQYRGEDIFRGFMRLSAVINNPNYTDYEVYILGQVGDFTSNIRDLSLQDINWGDLQHELTYDNITTSWEARYDTTGGLFEGKVLYPMINYGLPYDNNNNPAFTYNFTGSTSFSGSANPVPEFVWKPAVRLKEVVDRIFDLTDYNVVSEFFETNYFKSIYMDTFQNGKLGVETADQVSNQNIFKAYTRPVHIISRNAGKQADFPIRSIQPDGYDPLNNLVFSDSRTLLPDDNPNGAYFRVPYPGQYGFNVRFSYDNNDETAVGAVLKFQVIVRKSPTLEGLDTGTIVASSRVYEVENDYYSTGDVDFYPSFNCNTGDYVKVFIRVTENKSNFFASGGKVLRIKPFYSNGVSTLAPMWDLYSSPTLEGTKIVDFKIGLPDTSCVDFLKGLVKMFNLVVVQNEPDRTITMEPFNWYFNEEDRVEKDFTNKLDLNSTYRISPLSFDLSKELNFTYTSGGEEYLNKLFEDRFGYVYGRTKFISTNNMFTGEQTYELPFAALPTSVVTGADNFIIPAVYREIDGTTLQPYSNKPHIFFWVGNRYAYKDQDKNQQGTWYLQSGGTVSVEQTTYPCVSHLSSLDIQLPEFFSDLNYSSTFDFFGNDNTLIQQFTQNNLYNLFWEDYINDTYSNETRRLTGRFFTRPTDAYDLKLTDKFFIKDSFFRIEKINELSLIEDKLTEISFIKERGGYGKVVPPAPFYSLSGNTPYPSALSPTNINAYTGDTDVFVCQSTGSTGTTTIFVADTQYQTGYSVYYAIPFGYAPLPVGTFIRQIGTTDTYVVINTTGQIIPYDGCV